MIYLCDLTHTTQGYGSELVPYPIGCIAADLEDVRLFKDPAKLDAAFKEQVPDIIGFSNYMWNLNLSCAIAERIKAKYPHVLIVFGGPNFPLDESIQEQWLKDRPYIDLYVLGEGESPFAYIVEMYNGDIDEVKTEGLYGVCSIVDGKLFKKVDKWPDGTDDLPREDDLDLNTSPYLNGSLDEFLADPKLVPVLECNRGCPFTCTFCVDGTKSRCNVTKYSTARLIKELEYIAQRTSAKTLFLTDCNFGMYLEDVQFSRAIKNIKAAYGYPQYINASTGKNKKQRIIEVAKILDGSLRVAASLQSMDKDVLINIKRSNINKETLADIVFSLPDANTYSELILGLPGDTEEKHISAVCELVDMGYDQIRMHQLTLLPGSMMDLERDKWHFKTAHRILQRSFGHYGFDNEYIDAIETEEVVIGSDTFTGYAHCRCFALTVALFHNEQAFVELAQFIRYMGFKYSEFLRFLHEQLMQIPLSNPIAYWYDRFYNNASDELYGNKEDITTHASKLMPLLKMGEIGNNLLFNTQGHILFHQYKDLNDIAFYMARYFLALNNNSFGISGDSRYLDELRRYCNLKKGHLSDLEIVDEDVFHYDFIQQEKDGFATVPEKIDPIHIVFAFDDKQKELFRSQFELYGKTDQALGKIIARAPMKDTYRKTTYE